MALASVPSIGPSTLRDLLADDAPSAAWSRTVGASGSVRHVARIWERHTELGISVLMAGHPSWPARLLDDPGAPAIVFCLGDPVALDRAPTVALVGTRAPTRYGIGVAAQLGADLAAAGVSVVSGLALGDRRGGARGCLRCRCAPHRRGRRRARRPLPAPARPAVGAGGGARGRRVGVARRGPHGEVALPRAQPPAGRSERRRGGRREQAPWRLAPHGRRRDGTRDRGRRRPGLHPQRDVGGDERAPGRRRLPGVLCGRHPRRTLPGGCLGARACALRSRGTAPAARARDGGGPSRLRRVVTRPHLPRRAGPPDRPRPAVVVRRPRAARPRRPGRRRRGLVAARSDPAAARRTRVAPSAAAPR